MQKRPEIAIPTQDDVATSSAITTIRACHRVEFGAHEMPTSGTAVSTATEYAYLVNKI
jgi:hypothetical protein